MKLALGASVTRLGGLLIFLGTNFLVKSAKIVQGDLLGYS